MSPHSMRCSSRANRFNLTLFQQAQPTTLLQGKDLQLKLAPTLGETLNNEPGVSATSFGPGASRPIVRGLGEDRVRVMQNGTSVIDVSNVSPDHAVATDPLTIRSVEVVRGPATLLYGPNTIGGVVNVIDDRIPQERFTATYPTGKFETSVGSADELFSQAGALTWGAGPLVFHLDGFNRDTSDVDIPGDARSKAFRESDPLPVGTPETRGTLPNSATESKGAGLGAAYVWDKGYLGFSHSGVDSTYGTVAEPDVTIGLRQRRWDMRGAVYAPTPWIKEINYKLGYSDYDHTELEGSAVGTQFLIQGSNGRLELLHEKISMLEGALGYEYQQSEFSALGAEAFLPPVENQVNSLFFVEEMPLDKFRLQFGAHYDHQTNETQSTTAFGAGLAREFDGFSTSAALVYTPVDDYAVALSLAYTQRPPTYVELFANGPHLATGSHEATFHLLEAVEAAPVTDSKSPVPATPAASDPQLDLILRADYVNAEDRSTGEPIPRIPPLRASAALDYSIGQFDARLEGQYAFSQHRHADYELPTEAYFLVNASISYELKLGGCDTTIYLKGTNLTNEEARQSTSFLKDIAAGRLCGRCSSLL